MDERVHPPGDFDSFYARELPAIARAAWFVVLDADLAGEIAQEAFSRALQRWQRISRYDRPGAWVRTVAIRLALRSRDRRRREVEWSEAVVGLQDRHDGPDDPTPGPVLEAALRSLPRQQRAAATLRYLYDLDMDEVAEAMGCKPATARVHLHRARQALGHRLGVHDSDFAR